MTRKELGDVIAEDIYSGDLNRISDQLFHLQKATHVEKSGGFNNSSNRWSITSKGRSFYSDLNDDEETNASDLPSDTGMDSPQQDHAVDHVQAVEAGQKPAEIQIATDQQLEAKTDGSELTYDPFAELCIAIHTAQDMLNRLKKPPVLTNKSEKLQLLNFIRSHYELINTDISTVLTHIIEDLEKLEDAA